MLSAAGIQVALCVNENGCLIVLCSRMEGSFFHIE